MNKEIDFNLNKLVWIYSKLSEPKRSMLIGSANLLLGAQKIEEGSKKTDGNTQSGSYSEEKKEENVLLDSTNNL